jgi:hypothetical protein
MRLIMCKTLLATVFFMLTVGADHPATQQDRNAAASWANQHLQEAFDALVPVATAEAIRMPTCRVTTVRVSGSLDAYEYAIKLVEACPTIGARGEILDGAVTGEFLIAEGSPIADQLARLRLQSPTIALETAIAGVRIRRVTLTARNARRLVHELAALSVSPIPPTDLMLDAPTYELASATGMTVRVIEVTAASQGSGERRLMKIAKDLAAAQGFDAKRLLYDASFWN